MTVAPHAQEELLELREALVQLAANVARRPPDWVHAVFERAGCRQGLPCPSGLSRALDVIVAEALTRGAPVQPTRHAARILAERLEIIVRQNPLLRR